MNFRQSLTSLQHEFVTMARFVAVGVLNTLIGYAIILLALFAGFGDYAANGIGFMLGLPIAYLLHRRWTYRARGKIRVGEGGLYAACVAGAYLANLGVIALGREAGYSGSALLQLFAICCYAGVLFILTRFIVFREDARVRLHRRHLDRRS